MSARKYYSNWWYGVLLPIFETIGWLVITPLIEHHNAMDIPLSGVAILSSGFIIVVSALFSPVFVCCLWLDAKKLRDSDAPWAPNPWLWGAMGGLAMLAGFFLSYLGPKLIVALGYLYRRYSRVSLFGDTAGAKIG